ncbi:hypothetical protein B484DRAFT_398522, partial [Ochromonadaceae sp. CCMP2298]
MSLASIVGKYPLAAGFMQAASALISAAPATFSDPNISTEDTAAIVDGVIFLVPLFDVSGKNEITVATFDLVCDIVGGGKLAGDRLAAGQVDVTLKDIAKVLVPRPWVLAQAKAAKLFALVPALGATAGKGTVSDNPAMARGWDLDGNPWGCLDKRGAQTRLNPLMALTRTFSASKMEKYCEDILFDHDKLFETCMIMKNTAAPAFTDPLHPDAGLHLYSSLHSLAVIKGGSGPGSKFQRALLLHFNSMDHTKLSLLDFMEPGPANAAVFERDRYTSDARGTIRSCLEFVETFFECFSCPAFRQSLLPLTSSLRTDHQLWNRYDNAFVLFRKTCTLDNKLSLATGPDCAAYLTALAENTLADARPKTVVEKASQKRKEREDGALEDLGGDGELDNSKKSGAAPGADTAAAKLLAGKAKLNCVFHVAAKLDVRDSAGKAVVCTAGAAKCPYKHLELSAITKNQAKACSRVKQKDEVVTSNFQAAVEARTDWKVYDEVKGGSGSRRVKAKEPRGGEMDLSPLCTPDPVASESVVARYSDKETRVVELPLPPERDRGPGVLGADSGDGSDSDEDEESCVPQAALCVLSQLVARASILFPTLRSPTVHVQALALVERAYTRYHFEANIASAITAVGAFSFDRAALQRDLRDFEECGGDL